jgi:hypothetical protein
MGAQVGLLGAHREHLLDCESIDRLDGRAQIVEPVVLQIAPIGRIERILQHRAKAHFRFAHERFSQSRANGFESSLSLLQPETEFPILGTQPLVLGVGVPR